MTVKELAEKTGFKIAAGDDALENEPKSIYTCDLLSLVMGRAKAGDAWVTVMGNINAVAVAVLADAACIVVAEGVPLDEAAKQKAEAQDVAVLLSDLPVYETAKLIEKAIN